VYVCVCMCFVCVYVCVYVCALCVYVCVCMCFVCVCVCAYLRVAYANVSELTPRAGSTACSYELAKST